MSDIRIAWSPAAGYGDFLVGAAAPDLVTDELGLPITDSIGGQLTDGFFIGDGGLIVGDALGSAVLISLFTDRTADRDDVIVDGSGDPRGWWGDLEQDVPIGSKLWLRGRAKQSALTLALVKADITTALQWLVDDRIAAAVDVTTEWTRPGMLGARVVVMRLDGSTAEFAWAWKEIG